jgi:2-polyprenyl-3-methyl-5-hydroxy-6-metoxy-1,4-benzoquinol methylase
MENKNIPIRGNNEESHWNQKHEESYGHFNKKYEDFIPVDWESLWEEADQAFTIAMVLQNHESINNKSMIDIGCAHGGLLWYLKTKYLPKWKFTGSDFSKKMIEENKKRSDKITWEQRDVLLNPINKKYGIISCLQTIEHFEEGRNYKFIDNCLEHCEYLILGTVDTEDDCFGEHISFYKLEIMKQKGYEVEWEAKLARVNSPSNFPGEFHMIVWLIKGKL